MEFLEVAVIKLHDLSKVGRRGIIWLVLPHHCASLKEVGTGSWKQELMQRLWKGAAYWLAPHDLLNLLLVESRTSSLGNGPTHSGLSLPPTITN